MRIIVAIACMLLVGCITEPKIETTSPWEGHYYSFDELKSKTEGQQLEEKQSIWLLSNTTLKRLLKDAGAK